jgi:uncharacterized protein YdiU (UPF0061 family)
VMRDMFYDGHPRAEPGAVVCRVAPSFLRFGNFELLAARGDRVTLQRLVDYAITTLHPELGRPAPEVYAQWFAEVCRRTAVMIAEWMRVGFVHGVMNTDNMSILGLTIDYGPYGWIDDFDPDWTPNTTDSGSRRYRFGQQPNVAAWNLGRFAAALYPLLGEVEPLEAGLAVYHDELERCSLARFAGKLGIAEFHAEPDPEHPDSGVALVDGLLRVLVGVSTDMTSFFRALADVPVAAAATDDALLQPLVHAWYEPASVPADHRARTLAWLRALAARVRREGHDPVQRRRRMNVNNPKFVLRNYLAQLAIDAAEAGDASLVHELLDTMRHPYDEQPGRERFAEKRPEWARTRAGCSMLSCSS